MNGERPPGPVTLSVDIGGSRIKAALLDEAGGMLTARVRVGMPRPASPGATIQALLTLVRPLGAFDRVSVGFPGVVRAGLVRTAPNLDTRLWHGFDLAAALAEKLGAPVRLLNDASMQGLGVIAGRGLECVITLGTGFGFALYHNGRLAPQLELGQHYARKEMTYDQYVGQQGLRSVGPGRWRKRLRRVLEQIEALVTYDTLYIGGGNAKLINFDLPPRVRVVSNDAGILGGVKLWAPQLDEVFEKPRPAIVTFDAPEDVAEADAKEDEPG